MRLIYAGTPDFAVPALRALSDAGHDIALVLTQPDRPSGRGMKLLPSAVKAFAMTRDFPLYQPASLKTEAEWRPLLEARADAMVVAAYGLILPPAVLGLARLGAFNIHASLLPRWRGAAPIQRAIMAGDRESGICIMRMDAGLDTGPVLSRQAIPIAADETGGSLHDKLAPLGARMIVDAMANLVAGAPQSGEGVSYAAKISKAETRIDWGATAEEIERRVRAFNPVPGASTRIGETEIKIWSASVRDSADASPGTILAIEEDAAVVACGRGALAVRRLQRAGGKALDLKRFLQGFELAPGQCFESGSD